MWCQTENTNIITSRTDFKAKLLQLNVLCVHFSPTAVASSLKGIQSSNTLAGLFSNKGPCLPSDPEERKKAWTELKDAITADKIFFERVAKFHGKIMDIMNEDEQHNKQQETVGKLRQLIQEEETQEMCKRVEEMKKLNQSLK